MGWVVSFCLSIITLCSVAFIYFEYKPSFTSTSISYSTPDNRAQQDPKCNSNIYTDKYKKRFLGCQ